MSIEFMSFRRAVEMRKFLLGFFLLQIGSHCALGDVIMTSNTYSENFDSPTTLTGTFSFTPLIQTNIGNTGWVGTKLSGTGSNNTSVFVDSGTSSSGGIYSYGATASSERALGVLASGTNVMGFGFKLTNATLSTFNDLTISFTQENWRSSTNVVNVVTASYATAANDANFLSATTGFTSLTDLDLVGPAVVTTNGALDGNLGANQVLRTITLSGINLTQGSSLFFRWQDANDSGNDAGLAIDNFTIAAFTAVPEPSSLALLSVAGFSGLVATYRRRRKAIHSAAQ